MYRNEIFRTMYQTLLILFVIKHKPIHTINLRDRTDAPAQWV